jgi:hypothetical protein
MTASNFSAAMRSQIPLKNSSTQRHAAGGYSR